MADETKSEFGPDQVFAGVLGYCVLLTPLGLLWNWVAPFFDPEPPSVCEDPDFIDFGGTFCHPDPAFRVPAWAFGIAAILFGIALLWFATGRLRRPSTPVEDAPGSAPSSATPGGPSESGSGLSREARSEIYGVVGLVLAIIGLVQQLVT